jgi:hypothetical protein
MAIKGISDRASLSPRYKRIGKLKKGTKKINGRVGKDLTYFRFAPENDDPTVGKIFFDIYGGEPGRLDFYLPFPTMEENFSSRRDLHGANELLKEACDGDYLTDWVEGTRHYHGRKLCEKKFHDPENRCPGCPLDYSGFLSIILKPMWEAGQFGLIVVETHAINDIALIASKLAQNEPLSGKMFTLYRQARKIGVPNTKSGKRMAVKKSLLQIELADAWLLKQLEASSQEAYAMLGNGHAQEQPVIESVVEIGDESTDPNAFDAELENGVYAGAFVDEGLPPPEHDDPGDGDQAPEPLEVKVPEMPGNLPAACGGVNWDDFCRLFGFEHKGQAMTALVQIFGKTWREQATPDAWRELAVYQASKAAADA